MRAWIPAATVALAIGFASAADARATHKLHIRAGGYGPKASETTSKIPNDEYSNGAVDLIVAKGAGSITLAGVACYTGSAPTGGLPGNDEIRITVPKPLPISSSGSFSFSGPVMLTPEQSQTAQSFTTTFTLKGRFQNGKTAVIGTDSSPVCQSSTPTHFKLHFDPGV